MKYLVPPTAAEARFLWWLMQSLRDSSEDESVVRDATRISNKLERILPAQAR